MHTYRSPKRWLFLSFVEPSSCLPLRLNAPYSLGATSPGQSLVPTDSLILHATQPEICWNRGSFWNWRSYARVSISIFYVFGGMIKSEHPIISLSLSFSQLIPRVFPHNDSFQKNLRSQREPEVFRIISLGVRQIKTQKGINIQVQTTSNHPKEIT